MAIALAQRYKGRELLSVFSTGKNDIYLSFAGGLEDIRISFEAGQIFFRFISSNEAPPPGMAWFRETWGQKISDIASLKFDRAFIIFFNNGTRLLFKLYGPKPDIIRVDEDRIPREAFRDRKLNNGKAFEKFDISQPELNFSESAITDKKELLKLYPYFKGEIEEQLSGQDFMESGLDRQRQKLILLWAYLLDPDYYLFTKDDLIKLSLFQSEGAEKFNDVIDAIGIFSADWLKNHHFVHSREVLLRHYEGLVKKYKHSLELTTLRLKELENEAPLEEIGHIIMANMHALEKGINEVTLYDFYRDEDITIKMNPRLSPQQNAENYYRKSRNRHIEIKALEDKKEAAEAQLESTNTILQEIKDSTTFAELRKYRLSVSKVEETNVPYREFTFAGWTILVGKSAKGNDELISRYAHKNDLWLHARSVAGSHVIIRQRSGQNIPNPVLEKAAALAAWYSKGKNESLCPVIYTERKFVRKPKGAAPGQVLVDKEKVLMVKPAEF